MKKFFAEFKKFITRGNVVDMAVGVIVGSSFTAIVNALSNQILKPLVNFLIALCLDQNSLDKIYTYLKPAYTMDENGAPLLDENGAKIIDLAKSIYIDWGAFINAIINFFLIAFTLFVIVKIINGARDRQKSFIADFNTNAPTREDKKEMKKRGIKFTDTVAVAAFYAEKAKKLEDEKKAAEDKAKADRLANPTTEDLLKEIRDLMRAQAGVASAEENSSDGAAE